MDGPIYMGVIRQPEPEQSLEEVQLEGLDLLPLLSLIDSFGIFRTNLTSGHSYWTRAMFDIHGMEYRTGPVDIVAAMERYHEDDRGKVIELFEDAVVNKTAFGFVLRMRDARDGYKLVKCIARHRTAPNGSEEVYGAMWDQVEHKRAVFLAV